MNTPEEFFENSSNFEFDKNEIQSRIASCKSYVEEGKLFAFHEFIEETIQICIEHEIIDDGLLLTEALLETAPYNSELWQYKGIFLNNIFEFELAYEAFNKALSLNPSDVETIINKSVSEENLGFLDEAEESLEKALSLDPNNEDALFSLGVLYERKEEFDISIYYLERTVEADPDYPEAWYELGYCYESVDELDKALYAYNKYLELEPYSATGLYNKGIVFLRKNEFTEATNCFELSIAIKEDFSSAWFNLGVATANQGNLTKALESFTKAAEIDPYDESAFFNIGQTYEDLENPGLAIENYTRAIDLDADYYEALLARGYCLYNLGKYDMALSDFSKAIQIADDSSAVSWFLEGSDEPVSKEDILNEETEPSIVILENTLENWSKLARFYLEKSDYENALMAFNKCLTFKSDDADVLYGLSKVKFALNKTDEAVEHLKSAFSFEPELKTRFEKEYPDIKSSKLYQKIVEEKK